MNAMRKSSLLFICALCLAFVPSPLLAQKKKAARPQGPRNPATSSRPAAGPAPRRRSDSAASTGRPDLQFFVLDPRVKLETVGEPGPILVPPPPYWFGPKGTLAAAAAAAGAAGRGSRSPPACRPARFAGRWPTPTGPGLKTGIFLGRRRARGGGGRRRKAPQKLPALPVTVSRPAGADRGGGPLPLHRRRRTARSRARSFARRLGVNMNAARHRPRRGRADRSPTPSTPTAATWPSRSAAAGRRRVHRRRPRPRLPRRPLVRLPAERSPPGRGWRPRSPRRGNAATTRTVEFVGYGVATGTPGSNPSPVPLPSRPTRNAASLAYRARNALGHWRPRSTSRSATCRKRRPAPTGAEPHALPPPSPACSTRAAGKARFRCEGKKGDVWDLAAEARRFGSPLDLSLAVLDAGRQGARPQRRPAGHHRRRPRLHPARRRSLHAGGGRPVRHGRHAGRGLPADGRTAGPRLHAADRRPAQRPARRRGRAGRDGEAHGRPSRSPSRSPSRACPRA